MFTKPISRTCLWVPGTGSSRPLDLLRVREPGGVTWRCFSLLVHHLLRVREPGVGMQELPPDTQTSHLLRVNRGVRW